MPLRRLLSAYRLLAALVLLTIVGAQAARAQTAPISGRVVDAGSGEGLPNANIQVEGRLMGTVTNRDGCFRLEIEDVPAILIFRYIGFDSERVRVANADSLHLEIRLEPTTYVLDEVFVSGEDPAANIMRKVIERKNEWRSNLTSFRADAYNRYTVSNDTGIVMISETLTEAFWDRERGSREVVKARRGTANLDLSGALPDEPYILNLYDDDVEVGGYRFVGVTHPKALDVYIFELVGTRVLEERAVYDISLRPRRGTESAFVGTIAVLDSAYALLEAELRPGEAFLFPAPIKGYDVTLSQQFSNFGRDYWLPVDFRREARIKISFGILLQMPEITVEQISRLSNYTVNVEVPDSLYREDDYSQVDSAAVAAVRMKPAAVVPLTARESAAYGAIDSTMSPRKAFRPTGLMASSIQFGDDDRRGRLGVRVKPQVRRNRVEDYHLGVSVAKAFGPLRFEVQGAYLTELKEGSYGGAARLSKVLPASLALEVGFHTGIDPRTAAWKEEVGASGLTSLAAGSDQYDYFRNRRAYIELSNEFERIPATVAVRLRTEEHESTFVDGRMDGTSGSDRINPRIEEGMLRSLGLQIGVGDEILLGMSGGNRLVISVEHSRPDLLSSHFDFTHASAVLDLQLKTFLRRRFLPATLDVRLSGGLTQGELPIQRTAVIAGSSNWVGPVHFGWYGTLRTHEDVAYQGDHYAGLFWEHSFRTLPFELIGWRWAARQGYNVIVHGAHARTWLSDRLAGEIGYPGVEPGGLHHELGASLSGLFGLFRLDATWRLDHPGFTVGVGVARIL